MKIQLKPLGWILAAPILVLLGIHRIALFLDTLLFPSLKSVQVKRPVFIVGPPRSGTTFLHRVMASHESEFTTMPLWELIFAPALCQKYLIAGIARIDRRIGHPLARLLDWGQKRLTKNLDDIHATKLTDPEEDYLGLLPYDGCFLRVLMLPYSKKTWALGYFSKLPQSRQDALITAYIGLIKRHLKFRGQQKTLLSKNPSFSSWVPNLMTTFPDAIFVGLERDMIEIVPSQMSSIQGGLKLFGHAKNDRELSLSFIALLNHYRQTIDGAANAYPESLMKVDYKSLTLDAEAELSKIYAKFNLPNLTSDDHACREALLSAARQYKSRHKYALADFGLQPIDLDQNL